MGFLDYFRQPDGLKDLSPEEVLKQLNSQEFKLIDVRTRYEFEHSHIKGAESHPLDTIDSLVSDLDKNSDILLICATGHRSRAAAAKFLRNGFTTVSHLEGGMRKWNKAGLKTVVGEDL